MPPPPPGASFDARFSTNRMAETLSGTDGKEVPITIASAEFPVHVAWHVRRGDALRAALRFGEKTVLLESDGGREVVGPDARVVLILNGTSAEELPKDYALHQNYPNPFNPTTKIAFDLPRASTVTLTVYDVLGRQIAALIEDRQIDAGRRSVEFDGSRLPSGVYLIRLRAGEFTDTKVMMLMK